MKLHLSCIDCMKMTNIIPEEKANAFITYVGFREDGLYEIKCPQGHESVYILQAQKFEILFEIGAHAVLDHYYREAIASFTSSLERFYEFTLSIFIEHANSKSTDLYEESWKKIRNQSERQLGAFIFLWTAYFQESPKTLSSKLTETRNNVIHKGVIPNQNESIDYGEQILNLIHPQLKQLKEKFPNEIQTIITRQMNELRNKIDGNKKIIITGFSTILDLNAGYSSPHQKSLEQILAHYKEMRKLDDQLKNLKAGLSGK